MAELIAKHPFETVTGGASGLQRLEVSPFVAEEVDLGPLTLIAPYRGSASALSGTLQAAHGMAFPKPNRMTGRAGAQAQWFGRDCALLIGVEPASALSAHAALTDQSDGWALVQVSGPDVEEVLARLVPLDLSPARFKRNHTARSLIGHMTGSITRTAANTFRLMVFRSMVRTLFSDLDHAMIAVSARRNLL